MKAFIKNLVNGKEYMVSRDTREELDSFIQYQKDKKVCPWGSLEQILLVDESEYPERAELVEVVTTLEPKFNEDFEPVMEVVRQEENEDGEMIDIYEQAFVEVVKHKVRIPQEFTVTIDEVPEDMTEMYLKELRDKIEHILDKTDWLFVSDVIIPSTHRTIYKDYRQKLRDQHNYDASYYNSESEYVIESFDNYVRRTKPELFLDGGDGEAIIKKFTAKL